jgi:hypothetical protein
MISHFHALIKIDTDDVALKLEDSLVSGRFKTNISTYLKVLKDCFIDRRKKEIIGTTLSIKYGQ